MINWKRGFTRLTWVVSILLAVTTPIIVAFYVGEQFRNVLFFVVFLSYLGFSVFCVVWAIYGLVRFIFRGFLDIEPGDKLKSKDMNLKSDFKQIALVFVVVVAILSLSGVIFYVRDELYEARQDLKAAQYFLYIPDFNKPPYEVVIDDEFDVNTQREDWKRIWEKKHQTELEKLENYRSKVQFLKVFYGALIYGPIGFCCIFFIYWLLKWLGLVFRSCEPKSDQKQ